MVRRVERAYYLGAGSNGTVAEVVGLDLGQSSRARILSVVVGASLRAERLNYRTR